MNDSKEWEDIFKRACKRINWVFAFFNSQKESPLFKASIKIPTSCILWQNFCSFLMLGIRRKFTINYLAYVCLTFFSCLSMSLWMSGGILIQGDLKKACHFQNVFFEAYHLGMTMTIDKNIQKTFFLVQSKVTYWSIIISPVSWWQSLLHSQHT